MNRLRYKNRYLKWPPRENFLSYKKAKNLCNSLKRKVKKTYFEKTSENRIMGGKKFWSTVKPSVKPSKGFFHNGNTSIETVINSFEDESELTKKFNSHYVNINEIRNFSE